MVRDRHRSDLLRNARKWLKHAGGILGGEAGEDEVQGLAVSKCSFRPLRDLARSRRVMAAVEPDVAIANERSRGEALKPCRPISPPHGGVQRRRCHGKGVLVTQHGDGKRGVHRLMAPRKPRQRKIELTMLVAVANLSATRDRIPRTAAR